MIVLPTKERGDIFGIYYFGKYIRTMKLFLLVPHLPAASSSRFGINIFVDLFLKL
jgi:hypothetical protein